MQLNRVSSNQTGNLLYLVITNCPLLSDVEICIVDFQSDHAVFQIKAKAKKVKSTKQWVYDFKRTNVEGFIKQLSSVDLQTIVQFAPDMDMDINKLIENNVPKRLVNHSLCPPWGDHELCNAHKAKMKAHKRAERTGTKAAWAHYRQLRNETNKICKSKYVCFINELGNCTAENPKKFWSFAKTKTSERSIPQEMISDSIKLTTSKSQADGFNKCFHSVFNTSTSHTDPGIEIPESCNPDLGFISVTEKDVLKVLQKVNANKSSGPDNLSPIILKCFF